MASRVGSKGQIVISKQIREQLGVQPGWLALQRIVDDHVEGYFIPPRHATSLKGSLAAHLKTRVAPDDAWDRARQDAWEEATHAKAPP